MEDNPRHGARARGRATPLVQGGLALLVAGTLIMFSFLAFRTGFAEQPRGGITAIEPGRSGRGPVLLPSPSDGSSRQRATTSAVAVAQGPDSTTPDARDQRVLGTRVGLADDEKAGRSDEDEDVNQRRKLLAREEDGPEGEDHGADDDDDDSDRSVSRSRGHSKASRGHSQGGSGDHSKGGSRDHSNGSRHHSNGSRRG